MRKKKKTKTDKSRMTCTLQKANVINLKNERLLVLFLFCFVLLYAALKDSVLILETSSSKPS